MNLPNIIIGVYGNNFVRLEDYRALEAEHNTALASLKMAEAALEELTRSHGPDEIAHIDAASALATIFK